MANIKLYSTGCPKCNVLKKKLDAINAQYDIITNMDEIQKVCEAIHIDMLPLLQVNEAWGAVIFDFSGAIKWVGEQTNAN